MNTTPWTTWKITGEDEAGKTTYEKIGAAGDFQQAQDLGWQYVGKTDWEFVVRGPENVEIGPYRRFEFTRAV